ncbi:hypothetical protein L1987_38234 [Smallanthus sonchifolius]|uniref:Uncharacterized protein n=1 Tax=Smallanthus sonchifolius TaxID=185202 RepID=A0ACB9HI31_9ASTR|nr:hypothetical protein L1987_38234 [Smallanthus sonchifolius]
MAIQARMYSDNLTFPFVNDDGGVGDTNPSQNLIENACCLNDLYLFNLQQQQQYQQPQQRPVNQDLCFYNGFNKPISIHSSPVTANIQKQNQEIEGFISLQNERLRLALQAQRKQQFLTILKNYESKSALLLTQKDDEIKRATRRRLELEEFLRRTDIERQKWQTAANETEAMVMNLNNTIEQLSEKLKTNVEDEGSCCHENDENMKKKMMMRVCKSCFNEDSCVVMLPCRHLCSCESCDVFLHSCPVCKMVKKASIQVSLFDSGL